MSEGQTWQTNVKFRKSVYTAEKLMYIIEAFVRRTQRHQ